MKTDIHPTYHTNATTTCSCGAKYQAGSTTKETKIDVCSACHPFYTGKQDHLIDTTGRVDKFKAKMEKAKAYQEKNAKNTPKAEQEDKAAKEAPVVAEPKTEETPKKKAILEAVAQAEEQEEQAEQAETES